MKNSVIQKAKKFVTKSLENKTDIHSITSYLQRIGYTISFYEHSEEEKLIKKHSLDNRVRIIHAFTFVDGNKKSIYVNNALSSENKKYSILHETAHIVLGHLDSDDIVFNERFREMEADTFAYTVLNPPKVNIRLTLTVLILTAFLGFCLGTHTVPQETPVSTSVYQNEHTEEIEYVYITPTGRKYHEENCMYVKNKNCTKLIIEEAQKNYEPCSVCNP